MKCMFNINEIIDVNPLPDPYPGWSHKVVSGDTAGAGRSWKKLRPNVV